MLMFFPLENGVLWQFVVLLALAYRVRAQMSFTLSLQLKGFSAHYFPSQCPHWGSFLWPVMLE